MFYSLFHKYVNPKIELLMSSIRSLENENGSITSEITSLVKTKDTIGTLSTQIKSNVTQLKETITIHNRFDSLVHSIKKQLEKSITELKALDKTKGMYQKLGEIFKKIKKEGDEIFKSIKHDLKKHEKDVGKKLNQYISITKNRLRSVKKEKIPHLIKDIENLVGTEPNNKGILSKIADKIKTFRNEHKNEIDYLEIVHIPDTNKIHEISRLRPWPGDEQGIRQIESVLREILHGLRGYLADVRTIFDKLNFYNTGEKIQRIENDVDLTNKFGVIGVQNDIYLGNIESARNDFSKRVELIRRVGKQTGYFKENFINDIYTVTDVSFKELTQIHKEINKQHKLADRIRALFNNTKFLLEYFDEFNKQKKILDETNIVRNGLSEIGKLIESMVKFRRTYKDGASSIIASSSILFSNFEKNGNKTNDHGKNRRQYLPKRMSLGSRPIEEIKNHIKKLKAIKEFKETASGYSIDLFVDYIENPKAVDINGILGELKILDEILTNSWYVGYNIGKIRESYEEYEKKIKGTGSSNGEKIQSHVESIEKIPAKISELYSKVRYNIVLLKIAKSVNETLESVKENTWKLNGIETTLGYAKRYIGFMKKKYQCIDDLIGRIRSFKGCIRLMCIKGNVVYLIHFVLKNDIGIIITNVLITLVSSITSG